MSPLLPSHRPSLGRPTSAGWVWGTGGRGLTGAAVRPPHGPGLGRPGRAPRHSSEGVSVSSPRGAPRQVRGASQAGRAGEQRVIRESKQRSENLVSQSNWFCLYSDKQLIS